MFLRFNPENFLVPEACAKCVCATSGSRFQNAGEELARVPFLWGANIHAGQDWCWPNMSAGTGGSDLRGARVSCPGYTRDLAAVLPAVGTCGHGNVEMSGPGCGSILIWLRVCYAMERSTKSYQFGCCL